MSAQKSKPSGLLGAFAGLVGVSAVAGILVTAMVAPALAVTSMTVNTSIGVFDSIPDYIELTTLPQRNTLYAMKGGVETPFAQVFNQNREEVSWSNVSPFVKDAVVAAEDRRFYEHGGVDLASLARATQGFVSSGGEAASGGGSTLAMQLVKNIRVVQALNLPTEKERTAAYKAAIETSLDRKLKEMKLAIGLEKRYTKNEILLAYLNIAGFGGTTYGIESAAQRYYSVSAKDLTLVQAASLIAIVQQPNVRNLNDPKKYPANKARRDLILNNMLELGNINQAAARRRGEHARGAQALQPQQRMPERQRGAVLLRLRDRQRRKLPAARRHPDRAAGRTGTAAATSCTPPSTLTSRPSRRLRSTRTCRAPTPATRSAPRRTRWRPAPAASSRWRRTRSSTTRSTATPPRRR